MHGIPCLGDAPPQSLLPPLKVLPCMSVTLFKLPGPYKDTSQGVRANSNQCDPIVT